MKRDEDESAANNRNLLYSIIFGFFVAVIFLNVKGDAPDLAISYIKLVVAVGGGIGLLAKWISDSAENLLVKKVSLLLMSVTRASVGVVFTMLYYIAKG